jgi:hypothetical protein
MEFLKKKYENSTFSVMGMHGSGSVLSLMQNQNIEKNDFSHNFIT